MIVIGLDVHKQSVTAVAIDEAGRELGQGADRGRKHRAAWLGERSSAWTDSGRSRDCPSARPPARANGRRPSARKSVRVPDLRLTVP